MVTPFPYAEVFTEVEQTLIAAGSIHLAPDVIRHQLDRFKRFADVHLSDDQYYEILVLVTFYSGFKAETVTAKRGIILGHFPDWRTASLYSDEDLHRIATDAPMIKNMQKIRACAVNARRFRSIVGEFGSVKAYIDSFGPSDSFENLLLLKESLEAAFAYLGGITVYHFLTDIGLPVLKPDRVIARIFLRLGLIENEKQLLKTVIQGRKFALATGHPIRYIDIVFVAYGQVSSREFGIERGICLKHPRCDACTIQAHCNFHRLDGSRDAA
jgi:DNA-3-methyladenine glycosylase I